MRIIMFLMLSGFLLSQPINNDTIGQEVLEEIPAVVKPTVEKIVTNSEEAKKASSDLNKEIKKQLDIIRQMQKEASFIRKPIQKIRNIQVNPKPIEKEVTSISAIKPDTISLMENGKIKKYEYKEKTLFGIVFFSGYYPYILDENNKKIYLKK